MGIGPRLPILVIGSELERSKPDPLPYLTALERTGALAAHSIAFEDSLSGVRAAAAAGLAVVGMTTTLDSRTLIEAGATFAARNFTDPRIFELIETRLNSGAEAGGRSVRLAQFIDENGKRAVAVTARGESRLVKGARTTLDLARQAIAEGVSFRKLIADRGVGKPVDLARALKERRVLAPIDHKDPAHVIVTGTGLTHLGSAEGRDKMHKDLEDPSKLTELDAHVQDGPRRRQAGQERDRRAARMVLQGRWFIACRPRGRSCRVPLSRLTAAKSRRSSAIYLIDDSGSPVRVGFALGNEFSDHITERHNYLWLAHSKLRPASVGPELLVGDLPADINGMSRIRRGKEVIWEKPFLSGEQNMAHSIANLEAHHFKYGLFRRPGDVHVHFFGTATLSFSDGVKTQKGDVFEIESETFGLPLRNRLATEKAAKARVRAL